MDSNTCGVGLGMASLGRPEYINIGVSGARDKSEASFLENAFKVLDFAYQNGVRYFDTAPSYGKGEQFLFEWRESRKHSDIVLGTKWGYTYVADWKLGYQGAHEIKEHSLNKLVEQWNFSKKMLPALQIYQIHSATFESGVLNNEEVLTKLYQIKKETNVKIGLTSSGPNQKEIIRKALSVSIENEKLFDSFQVTFNILEQSTFSVLNNAKSEGKTIIVKEALANGRLFPNKNYMRYHALYEKLKVLAIHYNVGVDAIALRFCIDKLNPDFVLSGASNICQLSQNLKACSFRLTKEDLSLLENEKVNCVAYWKERSSLTWG